MHRTTQRDFKLAAVLTLALLALLFSNPCRADTNVINFTYPDRMALIADGWDFNAKTVAGLTRNTEVTNGAVVSYAQANHPGVVRIPVDTGDLWATANNTRNSLFRDLSPDWTSLRLDVSFAPTQAYEQAHLAVYQNDDNYVEAGLGYNSGSRRASLTRELNASASTPSSTNVTASNLYLRLDRNTASGEISAFYSLNGTNWLLIGKTSLVLTNTRLAIWAGGSPGGFPNADFRRLEIITSTTPVSTLLVAQPTALVFNAVAGQPCTNTQLVRVIHRGPTTLAWSLTNTTPWLVTDLNASNTPAAFNVSANTTGLSPGVYNTILSVGAPGALNNPASVNVTLIINPAARVRTSIWKGGKKAALSVSVPDGLGSMYDILRTNGFAGTYQMNGTNAPSFYTTYYRAGMELGTHLVHHNCFVMDEATVRTEIVPNIAGLCATTVQPCADVISHAWPCGVRNIVQDVVASDYFLVTRGYNINLLEDPTPNDLMILKSFNSHEHNPTQYNPTAPPNPTDLKTVVDAAIAQGKWANLVFHGYNNDDGAVAYCVGKDIWVSPIGTVAKYIQQRDRMVISNYLEDAHFVSFNCQRLPLTTTSLRNFESAIGTNDLVTFNVDVTGLPAPTALTSAGVATPYIIKSSAGKTNLLFDLFVTATNQPVLVTLGTNSPPTPPFIESITWSNYVATLTWSTKSGHIYRIEYKPDLNATNWNSVTPDIEAQATNATASDSSATTSRRLYRVLLVQ
jgi:regulation of enolase protein 1 (concanavalin A-like superfamily)